MELNLAKWGNSAAIRIPKIVLEQLNINSNDLNNVTFSIDVDGDRLILKRKLIKTKFELLAEKSNGEKVNPKVNMDWGRPVGKEVW